MEYLVVTEPVPAGAAVIDHSVGGGFERYELSPGAITFYIGSRRKVEPIRYEVYGYLPGDYRAATRWSATPTGPSYLPSRRRRRWGCCRPGARAPIHTASPRPSCLRWASTISPGHCGKRASG